MGEFKTWRRFSTLSRAFLTVLVLYLSLSWIIRSLVPPPPAVAMEGAFHPAEDLVFYEDESWLDSQNQRQLSQSIFDQVFAAIRRAREIIVIDMFLFNDWQGPVAETHRALSSELTAALIAQKSNYPELLVILITDPINTVYGGVTSQQLIRLQEANVNVVSTNLLALQDSNPVWSGVWRWLIEPWGNGPGQWLPNPFGEGRVSLRSYLALLNFKANHRKLMILDNGNHELQGWVLSANPHDGSSAHRNVAVSFTGASVLDLLNAEKELLRLSDAHDLLLTMNETLLSIANQGQSGNNEVQTSAASGVEIRVLGESAIRRSVIGLINQTRAGDEIDMVMFYLSDRGIVNALKKAAIRGVNVQVLLDVNQDAFGREKNGVPNRPVAAELFNNGVSVRWCATQGEQCHAKWIYVKTPARKTVLLGSANYTRRNLQDFNLETNVELTDSGDSALFSEMELFFDRQWNNRDGKTYSLDYESFRDDSVVLYLQYRLMEFTGLSTF